MIRYLHEYNSPAVPFAGLGYDTVMMVAEAIRISGSPDRFPEGMAQITLYPGVTGTLSYSGNSHIPEKTVTVMKIENGTPVHIGDVMPVGVPSP
jgi:branched-chain amino acid transport system substrate-binding protein